MPHDDGPDPMEIRAFKNGSDWFLEIKNPIKLEATAVPTGGWQNTLETHADDLLAVLDSSTNNAYHNAIYSLTGFAWSAGTVDSGTLACCELRDNRGTAVFQIPNQSYFRTIDYVTEKGAVARWKITWNAAVDPRLYDGIMLPVVGFEQSGSFSENDRFSCQEVSWGPLG